MNKIINLNILAWLLGIIFYYSFFKFLLSINFIKAFLILILAIIIFPPSFSLLKEQIKKYYDFNLSEILRLFIIITVFILFNFLNLSTFQASKTIDTAYFPNTISNKTLSTSAIEKSKQTRKKQISEISKIYYPITAVIDGDTIKININNKIKTVRLIGIDTPETVHPAKPIECFGKEASLKLKNLLENKKVYLENDISQDDEDIYSRLLRYVYREDGLFINQWLVENGYAYEYTYKIPYQYQKEFKESQNNAQKNKLGLWADGICDNFNSKNMEKRDENCLIKGNISYTSKEKIYHKPTCDDYTQTVINQSKGERWFCSEDEARENGWRIAENCF